MMHNLVTGLLGFLLTMRGIPSSASRENGRLGNLDAAGDASLKPFAGARRRQEARQGTWAISTWTRKLNACPSAYVPEIVIGYISSASNERFDRMISTLEIDPGGIKGELGVTPPKRKTCEPPSRVRTALRLAMGLP
ncbi:MAG TPA: hypothetical protein VGS04_02165, partial [Nitrososphaerales archaeon]|nr:hypothetical protein [Nitrososphaerales archaeon]